MIAPPDWFPDGHEVGDDDLGRWLALRPFGVGASEAAAALGCDPYTTPLSLYRRKALGERDAAGEPAEIGKAYEAAHETMFLRRTGNAVVRRQVFYRWRGFADAPLFATLDGVDDSGAAVEFKMTGDGRKVGRDGTDDLPMPWLIQANAQMLCGGYDVVRFGVLSPLGGHRFTIHPVGRDASLCEQILDAVGRFWHGHVLAGVPPRCATPDDLDLVERVESAVALPPEAVALADRYEALTAQEGSIAREKAAVKVALANLLGPATVGELPDGRRWVATRSLRKGYAVEAKEYTSYTLKRAKRP